MKRLLILLSLFFCRQSIGQTYVLIPDANFASWLNVILKSTLFPNPNGGKFVIRVNAPISPQQVEISIFDISGSLVQSENKNLKENNEIDLNSKLLNGTYLVKVKLGDGSFDVHRLVIDN
jgi:hypothetical protein